MLEQPVPCKLNIDDCNCINFNEIVGCNPTCDFYNPIDEDARLMEEVIEEKAQETKNKKDINIKFSGLPKFDKIHEFVVLKKNVFEIQNISPKKIILKFKRKLNDTDSINDGCYVFVDKEDKLLIPHKVFTEFDQKTKKR